MGIELLQKIFNKIWIVSTHMRIKFQVCRLIPKKSFDLHYMKKRFVLSVIVILIELYLISILFYFPNLIIIIIPFGFGFWTFLFTYVCSQEL